MATAILSSGFNGVQFQEITKNNQPWLRGAQIEQALGYTRENAVAQLYDRHSDEFTDSMTALVTLPTAGGLQEVRIFSLRGCHLLAMFARTPVAKAFRVWVLDVLEHLNPPTSKQSIETTHTQRRRTQPKAKYRDFLPLPFPTLKQKEDELEAHFASIKEHINAIFEHETEAYAIVRELMLPAQRNFDAKRSTIIKLHNGMENLWYALDHSLKGVQDQVQTMLMVTGI